MRIIRYFGIEACCKYAFTYIFSHLTSVESAPNYEAEQNGIAELSKVLNFIQNDTYYPTFEEKSAYLICSIAASQYFTNGNKRLSVTVLLMFLIKNDALVLDNVEEGKRLLAKNFPKYRWEANSSISDGHSLFLYNLAIVLGDRTIWDTDSFTEIRERVATMFKEAHELPSE